MPRSIMTTASPGPATWSNPPKNRWPSIWKSKNFCIFSKPGSAKILDCKSCWSPKFNKHILECVGSLFSFTN